MPKFATPLEGFIEWLPGELEYSARKAGYDEKVRRAQLPIDDPRSIYGFLGSEWHAHQFMSSQGIHHQPFQGKSGQAQLAKFSAGIFDKVAVGRWLVSGTEADQAHFVAAADLTAARVIETAPWNVWRDDDVVQLDKPFAETIFADGIELIMSSIRAAVTQEGRIRERTIDKMSLHAIMLGGAAVQNYVAYANERLTAEQFEIPPSQLAV